MKSSKPSAPARAGRHRPTIIDDDSSIQREDLPFDILTKRLTNLRGYRPNVAACCPAHRDTNPSLSVTELSDGKILLHCHAGCSTEEVLAAVDLDFSHLYPNDYAKLFNKRRTLQTREAAEEPIDSVDEPVINHGRFREIIRQSRKNSEKELALLAADLQLPVEALDRLHIGVDGDRAVFPERDDHRRAVGVCYRARNGERTFAKGGKRGLTIPFEQPTDRGPLYVAEGGTDTLALLGLGLRAIGRPAARPSKLAMLWLTRYLKRLSTGDIVIIGDNDDPIDGKGIGETAARDLAISLSKLLYRPISWALPPRDFKDVRAQIVSDHWHMGLRLKEVQE